jgi:hypothetical protein
MVVDDDGTRKREERQERERGERGDKWSGRAVNCRFYGRHIQSITIHFATFASKLPN